jgi:hypothetical protein
MSHIAFCNFSQLFTYYTSDRSCRPGLLRPPMDGAAPAPKAMGGHPFLQSDHSSRPSLLRPPTGCQSCDRPLPSCPRFYIYAPSSKSASCLLAFKLTHAGAIAPAPHWQGRRPRPAPASPCSASAPHQLLLALLVLSSVHVFTIYASCIKLRLCLCCFCSLCSLCSLCY